MIPKRAIFFWSGGEPSRLRRMSWESFAAFNPDWEIALLSEPCDDLSYRQIVIKSDLLRYKALHEHGGYYFDTDIVFRRPIPDSWLEYDNACVLGPNGMALGVAILGGRQGSRLWRRAYEAASLRTQSPIVMECQSLGIKLLHSIDGHRTDLRAYAASLNEGVFDIPAEAFFPYGADNIELLWSPGYPKLNSSCLGVHWFGGDRLSQEFEAAQDDLHDCLVRAAMDEAVSRNGAQ